MEADEMNEVISKNEIENFFKTLKQGKILWIKVSKEQPNLQKIFFAVFENYDEESGRCVITLGPWGSKILSLGDIVEISIASPSSLVATINSILKLSENYSNNTTLKI